MAPVTNNKRRNTRSTTRKTYARKKKFQLVKNFSGASLYFPLSDEMPPTRNVILKYGTDIALGNGSTEVSYNTYRLNSIFDPDVSVGGTPVAYYDEWEGMYQSYYVVEADVKLSFVNLNNQPIRCLAYPIVGESTAIVDPQDAQQQPFSKTVVCSNNGTQKENVIWMRVNMPKFSGYEYLPTSSLGANFGGNPAQQVYLHAMIFGMTGTIPASESVHVNVEIFYKTQLYRNVNSN